MGKASRERRERRTLRAQLVEAMTQLRRAMAPRMKKQIEHFPNQARPCDTCAFRTNTDSFEGFDATAVNVLAAMGKGAMFYCHEPEPVEIAPGEKDYRPRMEDGHLVPCAAWFTFAANPPIDVREIVEPALVDACVETMTK